MPRGTRAKSKSESTTGGGERQSLYFTKDILEEIKAEALSQDRSLSWIMQQAWRIAKLRVSPGGKATLLDAWIAEKAWTLDDPQLDDIIDVKDLKAGAGARKKA